MTADGRARPPSRRAAPAHPGARHRAGRGLPAVRLSAGAASSALAGWVRNDGDGRGHRGRGRRATRSTLRARACAAMRRRWPASTRCDAATSAGAGAASRGFAIVESGGGRVDHGDRRPTPPSAPTAWPSCFDPGDRRYRYPFINCTHCGPRYTITRALPYDRAQTSMAGFACARSASAEYARRATGASTPSPTPARCAGRGWRCVDADGTPIDGVDPIAGALRCCARRDRRHQGPGRLPPRLRRPQRGGRGRACASASSARRSRSR